METKPLLYGLIGFFIGGLIVSVAATTLENYETKQDTSMAQMSHMAANLADKTGDDFDKQFIKDMIVHHQGAVEMAKLADSQAKHQEIKDISASIISAQNKEIDQLTSWQTKWGYGSSDSQTNRMMH